MKVVILCGGQGTRLREETEYRPKPLVMVGDRPILWHIMKLYSHFGYNEFILCLGYKGDMIKQYFLNYDELSHDFTIELLKHHKEKNKTVTVTGVQPLNPFGVIEAERGLVKTFAEKPQSQDWT